MGVAKSTICYDVCKESGGSIVRGDPLNRVGYEPPLKVFTEGSTFKSNMDEWKAWFNNFGHACRVSGGTCYVVKGEENYFNVPAAEIITVGGVKVEKGFYNKACFKESDCTGTKAYQTTSVSTDFYKVCNGNGYKSVAVQWGNESAYGSCYNVSASGETDAKKTINWKLVEGENAIKVGGTLVLKGANNKACYTGKDCTGSQALTTNGVGEDFYNACVAKGHKSLGVQTTWDDSNKAMCFNVSSTGETNTNKTVAYKPASRLEEEIPEVEEDGIDVEDAEMDLFEASLAIELELAMDASVLLADG